MRHTGLSSPFFSKIRLVKKCNPTKYWSKWWILSIQLLCRSRYLSLCLIPWRGIKPAIGKTLFWCHSSNFSNSEIKLILYRLYFERQRGSINKNSVRTATSKEQGISKVNCCFEETQVWHLFEASDQSFPDSSFLKTKQTAVPRPMHILTWEQAKSNGCRLSINTHFWLADTSKHWNLLQFCLNLVWTRGCSTWFSFLVIFPTCAYLEHGTVRNYVCSRGTGMWYISSASLTAAAALVDRGRCATLSTCCFFPASGHSSKWSLLSKGAPWKGEGVNSSRAPLHKRGTVSGRTPHLPSSGRTILRCTLHGSSRLISQFT